MGTNYLFLLFAVVMFILLFFVRKSGYIEARINRLYCAAIMVNICSYLGYIGRSLSEYYGLVIPSYFVNTVLYLSGVTTSFLMCMTFCERRTRIYWFSIILESVYCLYVLATPWTKQLFVISPDGIYSRGPLFAVSFITAGLYMVIWFILMMVRYKEVALLDRMHIVFLAVVEIMSTVFEALGSNQKLEYVGGSFVIILFYVFVIEVAGKYDKMTGAGSRRLYFNVTLNEIHEKDEYAVVFFDVDALKDTNDHYGHSNGDLIIRSIAQIIMDEMDKRGKLYRIGGDEFVAIINSRSVNEINTMTENILEAFKKKSEEIGIEVSASFGFAIHRPDEKYDDTAKRADEQMYQNKEHYYTKTRKVRR